MDLAQSSISTSQASNLKRWTQSTIELYSAALEYVTSKLHDKNVSQLERLGTALLVSSENSNDAIEIRAEEIVKLKPHVRLEQAIEAIREVDLIGRILRLAKTPFRVCHNRSPHAPAAPFMGGTCGAAKKRRLFPVDASDDA